MCVCVCVCLFLKLSKVSEINQNKLSWPVAAAAVLLVRAEGSRKYIQNVYIGFVPLQTNEYAIADGTKDTVTYIVNQVYGYILYA